MTTETINGLLTQKANSPPPTVGAIKSFAWEQRTSKAGKPWIKIKNETAEYGGKPCRIVQAQQTDFQDAHGNLSYNLEIEPVNGAQTHENATQRAEAGEPTSWPGGPTAWPQQGTLMSKDDYWRRKEERDLEVNKSIRRQHSQHMSLLVLDLKQKVGELSVEDLTPAKLRSLADFFDTDVKEAANAG